MSSSGRMWAFRLRHMIEAVQHIVQYTQGMTFEQFCHDLMIVKAVAYNFVIIGEAARHIPPEVVAAYPKVPWATMRAMRNVVIHEYDHIDLVSVWDTIAQDLPPLVPRLKAVLEAEVDE